MIKYGLILILLMLPASDAKSENTYPSPEEASQMTKSDWKKRLTKQEYRILFEGGTERAHTGDLLNNKKKGVYVTAGCGQPVFHSDHKYDSKTGWPSFWQPISEEAVEYHDDYKLFGAKRIEIRGSQCGEHLGHVFKDGPEPTGLRYCINSAALDFIEDEQDV